MITTTMSVKLSSLKETIENDGVLTCFGNMEFQYYSKQSYVQETMPYRARGAAAVALVGAGIEKSGIATGYLDLQVVDKGDYKQKICTLVIRNFIPTLDITCPEVIESTTNISKTATPVSVEASATVDSIPF